MWTGLLDTDEDTSLWYWFNITGLLYVKTGRGQTMKENQENEHVHKGTTMEVQKITLRGVSVTG